MKLTKILALVLAAVMVLMMFASCNKDPQNETKTPVDPYAGKTHAEISADLYPKVLGEFVEAYEVALAAENVSERYALMAVAEAKLLQSGVMLPSTANGGNYAISRVAPYTTSSVLFGNDSDKYYSAVIVDGDPLTTAQRDEMKAKWGELKGTGTYLEWAKSYLIGKGYTLTDQYILGYSSDPKTWDGLSTSLAADSEAIVNCVDGLLEYNAENVQVPALAESYEISADGLTYTFKIREGVNWVDYQGAVIEPVTADSFVAGMQHMLDAEGGLEYLVQGIIKGVNEYLAGETTDFAQVGVKAVDTYTLQYTLEKVTPYFMTMLGYNIFTPMSRTYFLNNGGAFGREEYKAATADAAKYTYGTAFDKIAYCGPYLVTSATASNSIVFEANDSYWNKEAVNVKKLTWRYVSGSNSPTEAYDLMVADELTGAGLNTQALAKAKTDGNFDKYAYLSSPGSTSYPMFLNVYRQQYANFNDSGVAISEMTDTEKVRANLAMMNKNFRLAVVTALDRASYNATTKGDDLKLVSLVNSYTPGNFVQLAEEVTIQINGTAKTYPAGTFYGVIMQDQMDADNFDVTVWDPTLEGGAGASYGFDGWYNPELSKAKLALAIEELKEQGVEITKENPLVLEVPYADPVEAYGNRANALKQSIEAATDGLIQIRLVKTGGSGYTNWNYATYFTDFGNQANYNIMDNSGWGPDFGDPCTYLDTMYTTDDIIGYMTKCIGLY